MGPIRGARALLRMNQKGEFDCPGCAWPEPDGERSPFEFCEEGAKHVADEATTSRVTPEFFRRWSVKDLAAQSDYWLNAQGRITQPMVLREDSDRYEPIDWNEAFDLIAGELNTLSSPDEAIFYTSGRASNEAAFLYQLFVRQFGTNNLPDCSNMCHESSGTALVETIGMGKGTVTLEDFDLADAIFVIGQNPGTNHPRMLTSLQRAKQRGCKLVHINPLPETGMTRFKHPQDPIGMLGAGTKLADLFLQVNLNGDVYADFVTFDSYGYVTVLLGMNDGRYAEYFDDVFTSYSQEMTKLLDKIEGCGATAILMTPTMFDARAKRMQPPGGFMGPKAVTFYNSTLAYYGTWLRDTAVERGLGFLREVGEREPGVGEHVGHVRAGTAADRVHAHSGRLRAHGEPVLARL